MIRSTVALFMLAAAAVPAAGQRGSGPSDAAWPHWRGPAHTGVAPGAAPLEWSDTKNVAWKVEIPGRGHSSPVVWGDRIYLTTAIPTNRPAPAPEPAGRGRRGTGGGEGVREHRFEVIALDRASGKIAWRQAPVTATPHEGYHQSYGSFASNSPTTDGERVYASFGSRGVYAFTMDGRPVWQKDFGVQMRMFQAFGEGVGPVLDAGNLILLFDHEGDGFLTMLDAATGKERWRTPRTDGTNWAAPLVVTHNGRKQIVVNSPRKVRGYDYETGAPLWETAGLGLNTIPRAVQHQDRVLVMSGFINPQLLSIALGRQGDLAGTDAIAWRANRGLSYTASPVLDEGTLYFITDTGMVSALRPQPERRCISRYDSPTRTTSRRRRCWREDTSTSRPKKARSMWRRSARPSRSSPPTRWPISRSSRRLPLRAATCIYAAALTCSGSPAARNRGPA
jgi:outer membrane protein assembly factor BamB